MNTRLQMEALTDASLAARGLPEIAYRFEPEVGIVAMLRGKDGYYPPTNLPPHLTGRKLDKEEAERWVENRNRAMGVTQPQAEAMFVGSAFGWHVPLADPKRHGADK